jgi:hypothetical protein
MFCIGHISRATAAFLETLVNLTDRKENGVPQDGAGEIGSKMQISKKIAVPWFALDGGVSE